MAAATIARLQRWQQSDQTANKSESKPNCRGRQRPVGPRRHRPLLSVTSCAGACVLVLHVLVHLVGEPGERVAHF